MLTLYRKFALLFNIIRSSLWVSIRVLMHARRDPARARLVPRETWSPYLIGLAGAHLEVEGGDDVDFTKPHIFVMNHQSLLDIPAAFLALPVGVCFIAKKELSYVPFFGQAMRSVGMIFVDRSNPERAIESLRAGGELIRSGINVMAFPEGTRSKDGELKRFKRGVFLLALQARVPIVPMAIEGAYKVLPTSSGKPTGGKIRVRIGQPMETTGYAEDDFEGLRAATRAAVETLFHKLRDEATSS